MLLTPPRGGTNRRKAVLIIRIIPYRPIGVDTPDNQARTVILPGGSAAPGKSLGKQVARIIVSAGHFAAVQTHMLRNQAQDLVVLPGLSMPLGISAAYQAPLLS